MLEVLHHPWIYVWFAIIIVLRNVGAAFPEPDQSLKHGFGSASPGYRFLYTVAQGLMTDLRTIGINPRALGLKLKTKAPRENEALD